jgi:hypothetical protein
MKHLVSLYALTHCQTDRHTGSWITFCCVCSCVWYMFKMRKSCQFSDKWPLKTATWSFVRHLLWQRRDKKRRMNEDSPGSFSVTNTHFETCSELTGGEGKLLIRKTTCTVLFIFQTRLNQGYVGAAGWTVRRSNSGGVWFSALVQTAPWTHTASYTVGSVSFPRVKRPGRLVNDPPLLAPRLEKA